MHAHGSSIWALILPAGQKMAANNAQIAQNRNLLFIIYSSLLHHHFIASSSYASGLAFAHPGLTRVGLAALLENVSLLLRQTVEQLFHTEGVEVGGGFETDLLGQQMQIFG
jgi:hypothetical protein